MTKVQEKINGVSVADSSTERQLMKVSGILTSQIQLRGENNKEPHHYAFIKQKAQTKQPWLKKLNIWRKLSISLVQFAKLFIN